MSNLYDKLGPQGRALINNRNDNNYSVQNRDSRQPNFTPQELDFVIDELRNPKPNTTINNILGYLYNYIPYIKHERNLGLVIASFLNSPKCFGSKTFPIPTFEENYPIIEVFKLITDKKLKISKPTLSIKTYYSIIGKELEHFVSFNPIVNSWKVLPIICGIMLSNNIRNEIYIEQQNFFKYNWFFQDWDHKIKKLFINCLEYSLSNIHDKNILYLSVTSLALIYQKDEENIKKYTSKINDSFMINVLIDMIFLDPTVSTKIYHEFFKFDPNSSNIEDIVQKDILQKPVIKHLNKFSFLLAAYLRNLKYNPRNDELISNNLIKLTDFNHKLSKSCESSIFNNLNSPKDNNPLYQSFWYFMKNLLFSEIIIFQGLLSRFLSGNKSNLVWFNSRDLVVIEREYRSISLKIISNLYYLNFILLSIGQGGFDNYNFVYYLSIELSLSSDQFEKLSLSLLNYNEVNLYPNVLNTNYIMQSKVLFVLGLWENYLQSKNIKNEQFAKKIYSIVKELADDKKYLNDDIIEASHSVLLFYFANSKNVDLNDCIEYVNLLIKQFPKTISSTQLCIAIETIGKKILSNPQPYPQDSIFLNSADEFFQFLIDKCKPIIPGIPVKKSIEDENNPSFSSAQPISEIEANSTLNTLEQDKRLNNDIIHENKAKKPKDKVVKDLLPRFKKDYKFQNRLIPETARESAILALINLIPYFPLSVFLQWIDQIWYLILKSNVSEQNYLIGMLWKVLSDSLDLNRIELAMRWWYEIKKIPSKGDSNFIESKI
ncbi:uncharacterized protein KGF55_000761 [Candida pseudojiufengensis]|uniref:uncharacterized protein n=1 Tax=Candida pseudojiufengensis TaxID=497109 RepID=UPI0022247DB8|nr:uncharacterized protein KGF55_000761 [Candida pseudojiufengensis]KAI5966452.1 hypothetical protein KGF55_000761 [Candida pseudojiufengensis]